MRAQASLGVQNASSVMLWGLCFGALESGPVERWPRPGFRSQLPTYGFWDRSPNTSELNFLPLPMGKGGAAILACSRPDKQGTCFLGDGY